jgi:hypothetical protein
MLEKLDQVQVSLSSSQGMRRRLIAMLLTGTLGVSAAVADPFLLRKISPRDVAIGDQFGFSVAMSGGTIVAGSPYQDTGGLEAGAAYIFDFASGAELFALKATTPEAGDNFGISVDVSNDVVIVGAQFDSHSGFTRTGSAYVFDALTGVLVAHLLQDDPDDDQNMGFAVAISGDRAIAGAYRDDQSGTNTGAVYMFNAVSGNQIRKYVADDPTPGSWFGYAVDLYGRYAVVGAPLDNEAGSNAGAAYIIDTITGAQTKLLAPDAAAGDKFGNAVAIEGTSVVIGADQASVVGSASGKAYVYDITSGEFGTLLPATGSADDHFGIAIATDGEYVLSGATEIGRAGSAYIHQFDTASVSSPELYLLRPDDLEPGDAFGASVAFSTVGLVIGAPEHDDDGSNAGAVYCYAGNLVPPTQWQANDHYYERIDLEITWQQASAIAASLVYDETPGYLACIESADENDFIVSALGGTALWSHLLGGYQVPGSIEPDGGWSWLSGKPWNYENWTSGEPNNQGGDEDILSFAGPGTEPLGSWNDIRADVIKPGFVVEYPFCRPDFNRDGFVNSQDFVAFLNAFSASDPSADYDGNGLINSQDFVAFLNDFVTGC